MTTDTKPMQDIDVDEMLTDISEMTEEIRTLQQKIRDCSVERRKIIVGLRSKNVTYRKIASTMGVTEQNVYKILHRANV